MKIGRVIGRVVATHKHGSLDGLALLLVQPVDLAGESKGNPIVSVDAVGAGEGEFVLLVQGSSARQTSMTEGNPVDCTIVGIIDCAAALARRIS